jgi:phage terminase large subunit
LSILQIPTARVFEPLLYPSRYKGAHGGRGSGKSHFFAGGIVERAKLEPGFRAVCIREVQKSLKESAKRLIEDKVSEFGLGREFDCLETQINTPGGGVIIFQGMQDHTSESIKSLEGFDVAWVEEAQSLSQRSLTLLRPTIRKPGSELWFSWNRTRKTDPVDVLLTGEKPPSNCVVVSANWRDNPWFPEVLEQERRDDQRDRPEQYDHVWEGDYARVQEGAYFAAQLAEAQRTGRIGFVAADPLMPFKAFWDIGVSDSTSIWIAQFVGQKIVVLDYYEAQGQPLGVHLSWMRERGYGSAECILPHDAAQRDAITATRFEDHIASAGFRTRTIPNQGRGAAMKRVEAARRLFPRIWFADKPTEAGREALGAYHEKRDAHRNVGLGPEHDWASHGADSFGLMCVDYEEPQAEREKRRKPQAGGWMAA